jgi:hypothetical protein
MYKNSNKTLGMLYIVFGAFLFLLAAGEWLFKASLAIAAFYIINYGLSLRGMPPLTFYVMRWFSGTRPF